ncbi:hypothetical protein AAZX31_14G088400 [Glycine max]
MWRTLLEWMLQVPGATSYMGGIGKDKFGEEMKKNSKLAGVNVGTKSRCILFTTNGFWGKHFNSKTLEQLHQHSF